ncbi:aminoglycoside adenylyltransferase family protein [Burkholderia metallica]|uniref:Aminoglycoside (3'') (9) adenylyltransferase n=1 Tax=Burkholderia metallica TaxID=488729 RepID=A0ABT8P609_9BURK|nr:aminoglycoside adenylyltransferase family protein [Burkholderia metallica]MDN7930529.1 aminoglycoside adenylyltransferase family protein [Burkholderia metallica]
MTASIPDEIAAQVAMACRTIERHLGATLKAIHLFGSALDGGLKPRSDIDLLATVSVRPTSRRADEPARHALMLDLLALSAPSARDGGVRALEATVVRTMKSCRGVIRRGANCSGEWLRRDPEAGIVEPPLVDHDLAILLTKVCWHSVVPASTPAIASLEPVRTCDFSTVLLATVAQWNAEPDRCSDERNVVLALARIGYSAAPGRIALKDVAATGVLGSACRKRTGRWWRPRATYFGGDEHAAILSGEPLAAFIGHEWRTAESMLLSTQRQMPRT